jgi:hypothetical protein
MNENGKDFEENMNKKSYWKNPDSYSLVSAKAGASMKMQKPRRIHHFSANKSSGTGNGFN